jgi:hypothetical protein
MSGRFKLGDQVAPGDLAKPAEPLVRTLVPYQCPACGTRLTPGQSHVAQEPRPHAASRRIVEVELSEPDGLSVLRYEEGSPGKLKRPKAVAVDAGCDVCVQRQRWERSVLRGWWEFSRDPWPRRESVPASGSTEPDENDEEAPEFRRFENERILLPWKDERGRWRRARLNCGIAPPLESEKAGGWPEEHPAYPPRFAQIKSEEVGTLRAARWALKFERFLASIPPEPPGCEEHFVPGEGEEPLEPLVAVKTSAVTGHLARAGKALALWWDLKSRTVHTRRVKVWREEGADAPSFVLRERRNHPDFKWLRRCAAVKDEWAAWRRKQGLPKREPWRGPTALEARDSVERWRKAAARFVLVGLAGAGDRGAAFRLAEMGE